jgi:hypothetical protein
MAKANNVTDTDPAEYRKDHDHDDLETEEPPGPAGYCKKIQKEKAGNGEVAGLDIGSGYSDLSFYFFILV